MKSPIQRRVARFLLASLVEAALVQFAEASDAGFQDIVTIHYRTERSKDGSTASWQYAAVARNLPAVDSAEIIQRVSAATAVSAQPWLYAQLSGRGDEPAALEILSRASSSATSLAAQTYADFIGLQGQFVADHYLAPMPVPRTDIILDDEPGGPSAPPITGRAPVPIPDFGTQLGVDQDWLKTQVRGTRAFAASDSDTLCLVQNAKSAGPYAESLGHAAVSADFLFQIRHRAPALPLWYRLGLSGDCGVFRTLLTPASIRVASAVWISQSDTDRMLAAAKRKKAALDLPPVRELFEPYAPTAQSASPAWQAEAALFLRWALFADGKRHSTALYAFIDRSRQQRVTEAIFRDCFGFGYDEMQTRLGKYLVQAVDQPVSLTYETGTDRAFAMDPQPLTHPSNAVTDAERAMEAWGPQYTRGKVPSLASTQQTEKSKIQADLTNGGGSGSGPDAGWPPSAPPPTVRKATADEVGRILGDWLRMEGLALRVRDPAAAVICFAAAGRILERTYREDNRLLSLESGPVPNEAVGPADRSGAPGSVVKLEPIVVNADRIGDPKLLAVYGMYEHDVGKLEKARELLGAAVRAEVVRPAAYIDLAEISLADGRAHPGRDGKLSAEQADAVINPLLYVITKGTLDAAGYALIADTWAQSADKPPLQHLAVLIKGLRLYPFDSALAARCARLYAHWGYRAETLSLINHVLSLVDKPTEQELLSLRNSLGNSGHPATTMGNQSLPASK